MVIMDGFYVFVQNFAKIGQYAAELWPKTTLYDVRHLEFKRFEF